KQRGAAEVSEAAAGGAAETVSSRPDTGTAATVRGQQMGVDDADGLHQREHRGRADEGESYLAQRRREGTGPARGRGDLGEGAGARRGLRLEGPDEIRQTARVAQADGGVRVGDGGVDLGAIADDPGIGHEPLDI